MHRESTPKTEMSKQYGLYNKEYYRKNIFVTCNCKLEILVTQNLRKFTKRKFLI